jgi:hypothetical protein
MSHRVLFFHFISALACIAISLAAAPRAVAQDELDSARRAPGLTLFVPVRARNSADATLASREERAALAIDVMAKAHPSRTSIVAQLPDDLFVRAARADSLPDSAEKSYAIVRDAGGRIVAVSEAPESESGDWHVVSDHYFDPTGSTIVMQRRASFFNGCTLPKSDSTVGISETATSYFGAKHRLIRRTFVRTLFDGTTPAPTENCNESFQIIYPIYPTLDSLVAATGLGSMVRATH